MREEKTNGMNKEIWWGIKGRWTAKHMMINLNRNRHIIIPDCM